MPRSLSTWRTREMGGGGVGGLLVHLWALYRWISQNSKIQRTSKLVVNKPVWGNPNLKMKYFSTFEVCSKEVILLSFSLLLPRFFSLSLFYSKSFSS